MSLLIRSFRRQDLELSEYLLTMYCPIFNAICNVGNSHWVVLECLSAQTVHCIKLFGAPHGRVMLLVSWGQIYSQLHSIYHALFNIQSTSVCGISKWTCPELLLCSGRNHTYCAVSESSNSDVPIFTRPFLCQLCGLLEIGSWITSYDVSSWHH